MTWTAAEGQQPTRMSFGQTCSSQAIGECGEILRSMNREPILEVGDAQRGIELAQVIHGALGLV